MASVCEESQAQHQMFYLVANPDRQPLCRLQAGSVCKVSCLLTSNLRPFFMNTQMLFSVLGSVDCIRSTADAVLVELYTKSGKYLLLRVVRRRHSHKKCTSSSTMRHVLHSLSWRGCPVQAPVMTASLCDLRRNLDMIRILGASRCFMYSGAR